MAANDGQRQCRTAVYEWPRAGRARAAGLVAGLEVDRAARHPGGLEVVRVVDDVADVAAVGGPGLDVHAHAPLQGKIHRVDPKLAS
jgi:hypothetical protein